MSLSLLDRLTLFVHPQRVVLERQPWRGTVNRQQADVALPVAGEADWQPVLTAAEALLKACGQRGAALRIVVADHFVRYALLPWSDVLVTRKARQGMALALLKNALGDKANTLEIAIDRPAFARNGIAAGIDRQLLASLRAAAKEQRLRLNTLQPRLIAELAGRRKQLDDGWFACIDRGWLTLAGLRNGDISCLHNHRATTSDPAMLSGELTGLLVAESAAVDVKKLFICSGDVTTPTLTDGWEITRWPGVIGGSAHA